MAEKTPTRSIFCTLRSLLCAAFLLVLAGHGVAQTEPESSASRLEVNTPGQHYKTYTSFREDSKLSVKTQDQKQWIKGRLHDIQDSTITIDDQIVRVSRITEVRTKLSWGTILAGIVVFIFTCGVAFSGWIFTRAIVQQSPKNWWQWTLVILGAIGVAIFGPLLFVATILVWAFARSKYEIGKYLILKVRHLEHPDAAFKGGDPEPPGY